MSASSLLVAVQPPTRASPNTILDPPLAVVITANQPGTGSAPHDLSRIFALVALLDDHGNVVGDALSGRVAESAHFLPDGDQSAYFLFDRLSIKRIGRFSIRTTLMRVDAASGFSGPSSEGVASVVYVDSRSIRVEEGNIELETPSASEQRFLDSLPE